MKRTITAVVLAAALMLGGLAHAGSATWSAQSDYGRQVFGSLFAMFGTATLSSTYATGGDTLTASSVGLKKITAVIPQGATTNGYLVKTAIDQGTPTMDAKLALYNGSGGDQEITITYAADPVTPGILVYAHIDEQVYEGRLNPPTCHLEYISLGTDDAAIAIEASSPTKYVVRHDAAAASTGSLLFFDDDAVSTGVGLFYSTLGLDATKTTYCLATLSDGQTFRITEHAAPGTPGVQVYLDDDAGAGISLLAINASLADAVVVTESNEAVSTLDVSDQSVNLMVLGY